MHHHYAVVMRVLFQVAVPAGFQMEIADDEMRCFLHPGHDHLLGYPDEFVAVPLYFDTFAMCNHLGSRYIYV